VGEVISVRRLHMSYGDFNAARGIDLDFHRGETFTFVGPPA